MVSVTSSPTPTVTSISTGVTIKGSDGDVHALKHVSDSPSA